MTFVKPAVDLKDAGQNEFVQEYLSAFNEHYNGVADAPSDVPGYYDNADQVDHVIEQIQEIYTGRPRYEFIGVDNGFWVTDEDVLIRGVDNEPIEFVSIEAAERYVRDRT